MFMNGGQMSADHPAGTSGQTADLYIPTLSFIPYKNSRESIGDGKHEDNQPKAEQHPEYSRRDAVIITVPNRVFFKIVM
jgi:hypothetical protein